MGSTGSESDGPVIRVLEFYSGIGGLRYSLEYAGVPAFVAEAFDINDVANDVYEHNFGHRPNQGNIQRLTAQQLDNYEGDAWLLSPPCQPYTRQGLRKDVDDCRASSFLQLLEMLAEMASPPAYIFVENVVGFERSVTHACLWGVLRRAGFQIQEFILSPLQFGIPYSRPRYFCLAKRETLPFAHLELNGSLLCRPGPVLPDAAECLRCTDKTSQAPYKPGIQPRTMNEPVLDPTVICQPISHFLELEPTEDVQTSCTYEPVTVAHACSKSLIEVCEASCASNTSTMLNKWKDYVVPASTIDRWGDVFDIVCPESRRCCCFTKSYFRFAKGTGSFLAMKASESQVASLSTGSSGMRLSDLELRYFTPREVANLHSFPAKFMFPNHVTLKQRYALLGNSLSIAVVGCLLRYLFQTEPMATSPTVATK